MHGQDRYFCSKEQNSVRMWVLMCRSIRSRAEQIRPDRVRGEHRVETSAREEGNDSAATSMYKVHPAARGCGVLRSKHLVDRAHSYWFPHRRRHRQHCCNAPQGVVFETTPCSYLVMVFLKYDGLERTARVLCTEAECGTHCVLGSVVGDSCRNGVHR